MIGAGLLVKSLGLGVGLAVDAFSVSVADGLADPRMSGGRKGLIAGTFAAFQFIMPLIGWICVHTVVRHFAVFAKAIPWIALILLVYIGGNMLVEGIRNMGGSGTEIDKAAAGRIAGNEEDDVLGSDEAMKETGDAGAISGSDLVGAPGAADGAIRPGVLIAQGVATSIDALSVGVAFASLGLITAIICSAIIGTVTFAICMFGLALGNRIGSRFTGKAEIAGGIILILIGMEIWIKGVFL